MTVRQVADLFVRHWRLVTSFAVVGAVLGLSVSFLVTPSYTVRTELFVTGTGTTAQDRLQNGEYVRNRIPTYAGLVTSPVVLDVVRENLSIPASERTVADDVTAANPIQTAFIDVTVVDSSPERAKAVGDEIGRVANSVIAGLENESGGDSPVHVEVVQPAVLPTRPDSPSKKLYAAFGLVVGVLVGAGAGLVRDARAQRRRSSNGQVNGLPIPPAASTRQIDAGVGPAHGTGKP